MVTYATDASDMLKRIPAIEEPTDAERAVLADLCAPRELIDAKVSASNPSSREFILRCRVLRVSGRPEYSTHHVVIWSHTRDGQPAMA